MKQHKINTFRFHTSTFLKASLYFQHLVEFSRLAGEEGSRIGRTARRGEARQRWVQQEVRRGGGGAGEPVASGTGKPDGHDPRRRAVAATAAAAAMSRPALLAAAAAAFGRCVGRAPHPNGEFNVHAHPRKFVILLIPGGGGGLLNIAARSRRGQAPRGKHVKGSAEGTARHRRRRSPWALPVGAQVPALKVDIDADRRVAIVLSITAPRVASEEQHEVVIAESPAVTISKAQPPAPAAGGEEARRRARRPPAQPEPPAKAEEQGEAGDKPAKARDEPSAPSEKPQGGPPRPRPPRPPAPAKPVSEPSATSPLENGRSPRGARRLCRRRTCSRPPAAASTAPPTRRKLRRPAKRNAAEPAKPAAAAAAPARARPAPGGRAGAAPRQVAQEGSRAPRAWRLLRTGLGGFRGGLRAARGARRPLRARPAARQGHQELRGCPSRCECCFQRNRRKNGIALMILSIYGKLIGSNHCERTSLPLKHEVVVSTHSSSAPSTRSARSSSTHLIFLAGLGVVGASAAAGSLGSLSGVSCAAAAPPSVALLSVAAAPVVVSIAEELSSGLGGVRSPSTKSPPPPPPSLPPPPPLVPPKLEKSTRSARFSSISAGATAMTTPSMCSR
ncbi:Protein of unknown function [Gryllus bimaculatus]|nr:Protein of unknown function [Gryllus bimaculatus]